MCMCFENCVYMWRIYIILEGYFFLENNGVKHGSEPQQNVRGQEGVNVLFDSLLGVRLTGISHNQLFGSVLELIVHHLNIFVGHLCDVNHGFLSASGRNLEITWGETILPLRLVQIQASSVHGPFFSS